MMADNMKSGESQLSPELIQQLTIAQLQASMQQNQSTDDEIDLAKLWRAIWSGKWLIIAITAVFAVVSVFYALSLPNIYKSEALLAPTEQESGGLGGMASQLGGLASLAGVNLGKGGGVDKTSLAIEIMKSRAFVTKFIEKHNLLVPLMASKGWSIDTNKLVFNTDIYSLETSEWIREARPPYSSEPSAQEAFLKFSSLINISQDKNSSMVSVSMKHYSPYVAQQWVNWLVDEINLEMKTRDLTEAKKSIIFLEKQLAETKLSELQDVLYKIIEEQTKTIMFAQVRDQYVFKTIDPALSPERKSEPKRPLIVILGVVLGFLFALPISIVRARRKNINK